MSEKILVSAKGIEVDNDGSLIGEVRSNISVDTKCFDLQLALFGQDRVNNVKKKKISKAFNDFYCTDFYDSLTETKWKFIKKPKLVMTGVTDDKVKIHFPFDPKENVNAYSLKDGDITKNIKIDGSVDIDTLGDNFLTYAIEDSLGNTIKLKRTVTVRTNEKPKLIGVVDETITIGDEFYPLEGVQAIDKEDGDITEFIEITGKVNNAKADTYELTYSITDSDDNTVTASRNITVQENFNESEKLRLNVLNSARKLIGKPYVFGGNYPPLGGDIGTDCSGLCQWAYHENGIELTRTTYTQINEGFEVEVTDLKPGDLIFSRFSSPGTPEHVFMYSGYKNGEHWCVEAPRTGLNIRERKFEWKSDFRARRIIKDTPIGDTGGQAGDKASANIIYYVKGIEGYAPYVYRDEVGVRTLGYGMTGSELSGVSTPLSESEATAHLTSNFNRLYYTPVLNMLKSRGATNMLQREVDALVSFAYNVGYGQNGLGGSQLLAKYVAGERGESIHEEFKKWCHAGGVVLGGLVRRREEEWRIFSGSSDKVGGYNCPPEISYIGTNGRSTGKLVTENDGYGASPY